MGYTKQSVRAKPATEPSQVIKKKVGRPREWKDEDIEIERVRLLEWLEDEDNYFLTGFLVERGMTLENLARFERYSESFRETMKIAREVQEQRLVNLAVSRRGDGNFIKFVLQNKAGWKEKSEVTGDGANPLSMILENIAQRKAKQIEDASSE